MKTTICDSIYELDSRFEGQIINGMINCLALQHERFDKAVMTLGAISSSLAYDPLNSELHELAMRAWSSLKSDLWFHLELENALVFWWSGNRLSRGSDFVGALTREQREIRELVRQIESGAQKEGEAAASQAHALVAIADLLDRHIEHYETRVFHAIRRAVVSPEGDAYSDANWNSARVL